MTLPSPWALLLYACTKTVKPFLQSLFHPYTSSRKCHFYRTRQAWICSYDHFRLQSPCRKTSLPSIADKATADNPVLRQCTTGGTPVTASHARMTMTVTGLPHGGRKANFPLICSTALNPSTWRCTPIHLSLFLSASLCVCLCFHAAIQDGIRCHFRCMGQR